jgi:arylformamidase
VSQSKTPVGAKLITLLFFVTASHCLASPVSAVRILRHLQYFTGPESDPEFHSLDLYLPEGRSDIPLMFFVHGGGWRGGEKSQEGRVNFINLLISQGMGVASIDYRVSPAIKHPTHIRDVARAFSWIHNNAARYGIDADRIFVTGQSAGGHLVSLLALDPKYLEEKDLSPDHIKGVISVSGVYDLENFYEPGVKPTRAEQAFGKDRKILREASPTLKIENAGPNTPPFLIVYTDNDLFGFAEQAKTFYTLLLDNNLPARLAEIPARDHFDVLAAIGAAVRVNDINGKPILQIEDLLGPAIVQFIRDVEDGSLARSFHAVWPKGGPEFVPEIPSPAMKVIRNVRYHEGPGSDPKLNSLDLYLPEGQSGFPIIFQVHGGRWREGDKGSPLPDTLVSLFGRLGWGVVSTNYRISPAVKHPTHIKDVARAFAWVYKNGPQYGIDRNRIVIIGHSAGGHLVSLLGLDSKYLEAEEVQPGAIKGVVTTSGIYELASWREPGKVPTGKEQAFGIDSATLTEASPISYLNPQAPPFLITFTDHDLYLLPEQAHHFYSAFLKRGLKARLLQIPDRYHCCPTGYMSGLGQPQIALVDDILAVELVSFATEVAGPTPEITAAGKGR